MLRKLLSLYICMHENVLYLTWRKNRLIKLKVICKKITFCRRNFCYAKIRDSTLTLYFVRCNVKSIVNTLLCKINFFVIQRWFRNIRNITHECFEIFLNVVKTWNQVTNEGPPAIICRALEMAENYCQRTKIVIQIFFGHSQKQKYLFVEFFMTHFLSQYNFDAALIVF